MISELKQADFYKCRELINEKGQMEVKAVVEGINPGRIFVDHPDSPNSGLVWLGNNDGFLFIGDESNEEFNSNLNQFIDNVIIPEAKKVDLDWFEGIGNHEKWNKKLEELFKHRTLGSWNQRVYMLTKDDLLNNSDPTIGREYTVLQISKALFDGDDRDIEFLRSKILEFWPSIGRFFEVGIGYCVVYRNEIVSVCFSGFVVDTVHCIDIETVKDHQGKKLAQSLAYRFTKDCLDQNLVPYWDCMEVNKPSIAVAEKIGFKNVFNYVGYDFPIE